MMDSTSTGSLSKEKRQGEPNSSDSESEPCQKVMRLINGNEPLISMNKHFINSKFIDLFKDHWNCEKDFNNSEARLYNKPFKLCLLENFIENENIIDNILKETDNIDMSRKQMDLFEFYQSSDLSNIKTGYLKEFYVNLQNNVMPWIENLCGIKLTHVSASCSMYKNGDYLLVHDDLLNDRQIAFIFYISPWNDVKTWTTQMGGCLEIFNTDNNGLPIFPIVNRILPKNNQFVFFKVCSNSYHHVSEVTNSPYPRLTINGWFHGDMNINNNLNLVKTNMNVFKTPIYNETSISKWINSIYLNKKTKKNIQKHIEEMSEIRLEEFLIPSMLEQILNELQMNENICWHMVGPANLKCYEILKRETCEGTLNDFFDLFDSKELFKLLHQYTDLDLSGSNVQEPKYIFEIQRWTHGFYTILDDNSTKDDDSLDLILYLNDSPNVAVITYLSPEEGRNSEEDAVLLTITSKKNSLNLVYRTKGTAMFTKYVSKKAEMVDPYVYVIVCRFQE